MPGTGECQLEKLAAVDKEFTFSTILLGVPHTVVFMDHLPTAEEVFKYGSVIEPMTSLFPRKTNVNFTHVLDDHTHRGAHAPARLRPHACLRHGFLQRGGVLRNGRLYWQKGGSSAGAWLAAH